MSRFLLTWEIGGGDWHLAQLLPLAAELKRRGHESVLAVRDILTAEPVLADGGYGVLQAPICITKTSPSTPGSTYPGLLAHCGYDRPEGVRGMLKAWLSLIDLVAPDFV